MYIIHCKMKGVLPVVMTRNTFFMGCALGVVVRLILEGRYYSNISGVMVSTLSTVCSIESSSTYS